MTEGAKHIVEQFADHLQKRAASVVTQFTVRGIAKVTTVMFLVAVTHNLLRWVALGV